MNNLDGATKLLTLYLDNMQMIKWRLNVIYNILNKVKTTGYRRIDIETCALQIRKILELIAFSALVSNADIYKEQLKDIEKMKNAQYILKDIERIHPNFYPQPFIVDPNNKHNWLEYPAPYLTRKKFEKVYDRCGKFLHEYSPFLPEEQKGREFLALEKDIKNWGQLIINLLSTHKIHLYDEKGIFRIEMNALNEKGEFMVDTNLTPIGDIWETIKSE